MRRPDRRSAPVTALVHAATCPLVASQASSRVPSPATRAASWRTQRIRSAAASGWSPNSCAIRPAQPPVPNRRTVPVIASATMPAVGASDGCNPEANSASHRASFRFGRVAASCVEVGISHHTGSGLLESAGHRIGPFLWLGRHSHVRRHDRALCGRVAPVSSLATTLAAALVCGLRVTITAPPAGQHPGLAAGIGTGASCSSPTGGARRWA